MAFSTLFLCLLSRACNVFPITWLANRRRRKSIPFRMQLCIWFSGLRGAIAFALSLQVPTKNSSAIMTSTLVVVMVTTFIFGGLTEPMLRYNGMKTGGGVAKAPKVKGPKTPAALAARAAAQRVHMTEIEKFWLSFDNMYMKYWFGGEIDEEWSVYREPVAAASASAEGHGHGDDDDSSDDEDTTQTITSDEALHQAALGTDEVYGATAGGPAEDEEEYEEDEEEEKHGVEMTATSKVDAFDFK